MQVVECQNTLDVVRDDGQAVEVDGYGLNVQRVRWYDSQFFVSVDQSVPQAFRDFGDQVLQHARGQFLNFKKAALALQLLGRKSATYVL